MKRVAVLTTFQDLPSGYGLVPVVLSQLQMLVDQGYTPGLFCVSGFENHQDAKKVPKGVELQPYVPFQHLTDYQPDVSPKENFRKQVKEIELMLEPTLKTYEVVITHDIVFQTWFLTHNIAIRGIANRYPYIKWLHWLHSGPSARPTDVQWPHSARYTGMDDATWISPNQSMIEKFARMYHIPEDQVQVVYHVFDIMKFYDMHPVSRNLIEKNNLLDCDVLAVLPARMSAGKQIHKAAWLIGALNDQGLQAKLLVLNSFSNNPPEKKHMQFIKDEAAIWNVPPDSLIFSSEQDKKYELGVPQKVVRDMMLISNLFIFPSQAETFSMVTAEAAACKNLLVLNEDLAPLKELYPFSKFIGWEADWGGTRINRQYQPDAKSYIKDRALEIVQELEQNKALRQHRVVLKKFNADWIWKHQLKPLIEG